MDGHGISYDTSNDEYYLQDDDVDGSGEFFEGSGEDDAPQVTVNLEDHAGVVTEEEEVNVRGYQRKW